jgi:PTH1 family peptidyl-tRNA hydrolase
MKLIVGLGNPEKTYGGTRHNVGFEVIDKIAQNNDVKISKLNFKAYIGEGVIRDEKIILMKPQTFMNLSGLSVRSALDFYKLTIADLLIFFDDVSLPAGNIRIRRRGSSGGHNGIKDIIREVCSEEFLRVKIGIGEKPEYWDLADFVLTKFNRDERKKIDDAISRAAEAAELLVKNEIDFAMSKYN